MVFTAGKFGLGLSGKACLWNAYEKQEESSRSSAFIVLNMRRIKNIDSYFTVVTCQ